MAVCVLYFFLTTSKCHNHIPQTSPQKKLWRLFFLVLSLFYRSQIVNFKEIYHFSRFQRGSNIFQGESNCLFPIETHITCDFPGGVGPGPPVPPSGSALAKASHRRDTEHWQPYDNINLMKKSNQLSFPQNDDCKTRKDTKHMCTVYGNLGRNVRKCALCMYSSYAVFFFLLKNKHQWYHLNSNS